MNPNSPTSIPEWQAILWRFVYDNIAASNFEKWVYAAKELDALLDPDIYLHLLEANYQDRLQVHELKNALEAWLITFYPLACECLKWKDYQVIPLGFETRPDIFMEKFTLLKRQTPWIDLVSCKACAQIWYLATDTRDDNYHIQRLTADDVDKIEKGSWPAVFNNIEAVWPRQE